MSDVLPPVAKSIFINCKKCEAERWHLVLTHTSPTAAKVECEVCKSKKTYTLPKAAKLKTPRVVKAKATGGGRSKTAHLDEYNSLMDQLSKEPVVPYNMRATFHANARVEHPKFGVGVVRNSLHEKIEVVFKDEVRSLVHGRG
jgi:hypothetical protein